MDKRILSHPLNPLAVVTGSGMEEKQSSQGASEADKIILERALLGDLSLLFM